MLRLRAPMLVLLGMSACAPGEYTDVYISKFYQDVACESPPKDTKAYSPGTVLQLTSSTPPVLQVGFLVKTHATGATNDLVVAGQTLDWAQSDRPIIDTVNVRIVSQPALSLADYSFGFGGITDQAADTEIATPYWDLIGPEAAVTLQDQGASAGELYSLTVQVSVSGKTSRSGSRIASEPAGYPVRAVTVGPCTGGLADRTLGCMAPGTFGLPVCN